MAKLKLKVRDAAEIRRVRQAKMARMEHASYLRWVFSWEGTALEAAWKDLLIPGVMAAIVTVVYKFGYALHFNTTSHEVTNMPVSFLVVFRTTIAFGRFWEGRMQLLETNNRILLLARACLTHLHCEEALLDRICRLLKALPVCIRWDLQAAFALPDVAKELDFMLPEEVAALQQSQGVWVVVLLQWLTHAIHAAANDSRLRSIKDKALFDEHVDKIQRGWLGMNAIATTPIPFPLVHLCTILLMVWFTTVPFALVESLGWFAPVVVLATGFGLFGINHVGSELENPFGKRCTDLVLELHERDVQNQIDFLRATISKRPLEPQKAAVPSSKDMK